MFVIGLTGGIGSGKSTVADYFRSLDVPVIDADLITRELVEPGQEALNEIIKYFGDEIIQHDGHLNRARLSDRIFKNTDERRALENILHPRARQVVRQRVSELDSPYCILCVPLLIESGWTDMVQRVLVVDLPPEIQLQRVIERDKITTEKAKAIIQAQIGRDTRLAVADDILDNTRDKASLLEQINALHRKYLALANPAS